MDNFCLGLEILAHCEYDPASPSWRILSLGDSLAAIALILTFSQLLTLTLKLRIQRTFKKIYWMWGFAVLALMLASLLPIIPGDAVPLLGYPIFWEFIGAAFIVISISVLIWKFNSPLKFNKRSSNSLMPLIVQVLARGEEKDHAELATAMKPIIRPIVSYAKSYDPIHKKMVAKNKEKYTTPPMALQAMQILQLCSDQSFCSTVVRKDPAFAVILFEEIKEQSAYNNNFAKPLVHELVRQAMINVNSILHREEAYRGLAISRPLISVLGFQREARKTDDRDGRLYQKFYDYIRQTFVLLYEKDQERALDKLPVNVTYDPDKRRLVQLVRKGDERFLDF